MLHRNLSAGTAAQQSSKSPLLFRPAIMLAMLLLCAVYLANSQNTTVGYNKLKEIKIPSWNVLIGKGAGKYFISESYCVVVGHDSIHVNSKGRDMTWLVDWNEPYLNANNDIKKILFEYYNNVIKKGKDTKDLRQGLVYRIIHRGNVLIGKDARVFK